MRGIKDDTEEQEWGGMSTDNVIGDGGSSF